MLRVNCGSYHFCMYKEDLFRQIPYIKHLYSFNKELSDTEIDIVDATTSWIPPNIWALFLDYVQRDEDRVCVNTDAGQHVLQAKDITLVTRSAHYLCMFDFLEVLGRELQKYDCPLKIPSPAQYCSDLLMLQECPQTLFDVAASTLAVSLQRVVSDEEVKNLVSLQWSDIKRLVRCKPVSCGGRDIARSKDMVVLVRRWLAYNPNYRGPPVDELAKFMMSLKPDCQAVDNFIQHEVKTLIDDFVKGQRSSENILPTSKLASYLNLDSIVLQKHLLDYVSNACMDIFGGVESPPSIAHRKDLQLYPIEINQCGFDILYDVSSKKSCMMPHVTPLMINKLDKGMVFDVLIDQHIYIAMVTPSSKCNSITLLKGNAKDVINFNDDRKGSWHYIDTTHTTFNICRLHIQVMRLGDNFILVNDSPYKPLVYKESGKWNEHTLKCDVICHTSIFNQRCLLYGGENTSFYAVRIEGSSTGRRIYKLAVRSDESKYKAHINICENITYPSDSTSRLVRCTSDGDAVPSLFYVSGEGLLFIENLNIVRVGSDTISPRVSAFMFVENSKPKRWVRTLYRGTDIQFKDERILERLSIAIYDTDKFPGVSIPYKGYVDRKRVVLYDSQRNHPISNLFSHCNVILDVSQQSVSLQYLGTFFPRDGLLAL